MLQTVNNKTMLTEGAYDFFKKAAQIYIPALGTFYFALSTIWGLPFGKEIVGSLMAFDTFLGVCLGISTNNYDDSGAAHDGEMVAIPKPDGGVTYSLNFNGDPQDIVKQDSVSFKVVPPDPSDQNQGPPPTGT